MTFDEAKARLAEICAGIVRQNHELIAGLDERGEILLVVVLDELRTRLPVIEKRELRVAHLQPHGVDSCR